MQVAAVRRGQDSAGAGPSAESRGRRVSPNQRSSAAQAELRDDLKSKSEEGDSNNQYLDSEEDDEDVIIGTKPASTLVA